MCKEIIVQLSDLHICKTKHTILQGVNPFDNLCMIIEHLKKFNIKLILLTGDNSEDGAEQSYELIVRCLTKLNVPVYAIPGNHDNSTNMTKAFLKHGIRLDKSISLSPEWQLLLLNTQMKNENWGYLDEDETEFLKYCLAKYQHKNVIIFMHHHPISIASQWMDQYQLSNAALFLKIIQSYENIKAVSFGHVHQVFEKIVDGKSYLSAPSTHIQFYPGAEKRQLDSLAPGYRWFKIKQNFYQTGIHRLS